LRADAVLEGSVTRSADRVRINADLILVSTGRQIWSEMYEGRISDLFTTQRALARDASTAMKVQLTEPEQTRRSEKRDVNPEAYDLYLRGRFHAERENANDNDQAIALYERSAALDKGFGAVQAELARMYGLKSFYFAPQDPQWEEKGFVAVQK